MNRKQSIVFHLIGWHQQGALGDDLLAIAVKQIFDEGARSYGIDLVWGESPETSDYIIVGGGTLLGIDNIGILETLLKCRKPYSIFGTGFRRERRDIGKVNADRLRELLENADFVFLRGYLSKQFCVHAGIKRGEVIGDPAFQFSPIPVPMEEGHGIKVGVSIRSMDNQSEPQYTDNDHCREMIRDIANFVAGQKRCEFFFFDLAKNIYDADQLAISALITDLNGKYHCHMVPFSMGVEKAFSILARMDYMISQRLHPTIVAWSNGVSHISLDYQNGKTEDFLSTIGMTEFGLRTDDFTMGGYRRKWNRLMKERATVSSQALQSVVYWRDIQRSAAKKILQQSIRTGE